MTSLKEYYVDYDINGGEYTGHLVIRTYDTIRVHQKRYIDIGDNTTIQLDEDIEGVEILENNEWIDITDAVTYNA